MDFTRIYHRIAGIILVPIAMFAPFNAVRIWANRMRGVGVSKKAYIGFMTFLDQPIGAREPKVVIEDGAVIEFHNIIFSHDTSAQMRGQSEESAWGKVTIKKGAYLGPNVTVLMNVTIGENAIVEAGSVVTKDVSPNAKVAGIPAKEIQQPK